MGPRNETKNTSAVVERNPNEFTLQWWLGMLIASCFSLVYIVTPVYMLSCFLMLVVDLSSGFSLSVQTMVYIAPLVISIMIPPIQMPGLVGVALKPLLSYFQYEEHSEWTDEQIMKDLDGGKKVILAFVPHGVISYCGIVSWVNTRPLFRRIKTAAASSVLKTPFLKNVMGIFGLVDASKASLQRHFRTNTGVDATVVIYVGGLAELFRSSPTEERLFLSKRKGFIKLALREGIDVVPGYLFGNTTVLTVFRHGPLAALSRNLGVALTYFWGKWYLPIPRDERLLYVRGKPLGMPSEPTAEPTQKEIDIWHQKYCDEVKRLFDENKEKLPSYKHKTLYID